jgi:hypothetical protein
MIAAARFHNNRKGTKLRFKHIGVLITTLTMATSATPQSLPNQFPLPNGSGLLETYNINNAPINLKGAFFNHSEPMGGPAPRVIFPPRAEAFRPRRSNSAFF